MLDHRYPLARRVANDPAHRRLIVILKPAAQRVGHEFFRDRARESVRLLEEEPAQSRKAVDFFTAGSCSARVYRLARFVDRAPAADDVEILKGETQADRSPSGSCCKWDSVRCCASRSRIVGGSAPGFVSSVALTPGGGGGIGNPKILFSSHLPRTTGDVRLGYDVMARRRSLGEKASALIVVGKALRGGNVCRKCQGSRSAARGVR